MKKLLANYLLVVSIAYVIIGLTTLFALRHHLVVFPLTNLAIYDANSLLMNWLLFRLPTVVFGVLGIIGVYLIKKDSLLV